jgi:hypothetical protein
VSVTGPTRELACLALGHDDTGEVRCPATDEQLMRELVAEVQRLRVAVGEVEETPTDRAEALGAVDDAINAATGAFVTGTEFAHVVVDHLADNGYRVVPTLPR